MVTKRGHGLGQGYANSACPGESKGRHPPARPRWARGGRGRARRAGGRVVHPVTTTGTRRGVPGVRGDLDVVKGRGDPSAGRARTGGAGPLVWHKTRWRCRERPAAGVVHRVAPRGPGPGPADQAAAAEVRRRRPRSGSPACAAAGHYRGVLAGRRTPRCRAHRRPLAEPLPRCACSGSTRPAAVSRSGPRTRLPGGGASRTTGGTPGSSTPPAPAGCSPTSRDAPPRRSTDWLTTSPSRGGPGSRT